jgi:hypothetical protein
MRPTKGIKLGALFDVLKDVPVVLGGLHDVEAFISLGSFMLARGPL